MTEVIELSKRDVESSLLRARLARTMDERFLDVMRMQRMVEALNRAGRSCRESELWSIYMSDSLIAS